MKKILILGAGMVGRAIAADLAIAHHVTSADIDVSALDLLSKKDDIKKIILDVNDKTALRNTLKEYDLVISAVPGFLGMETMTEVIQQKKNLVDISFMAEDVLHLDSLAKRNRVTAVMDCGIAPGMPNYIVGYHNESMQINELEYMVGGLPKIRRYPFEYKAPFSPYDVIEEYTRPARIVENGKIVVKPAMSDPELVDVDKVGTLEAFNTDGLRSLVYTMKHIPLMREKTLRYPGHIDLIKSLREAGFFSREQIEIAGKKVTPFDVTSQILIKAWKLDQEEPEFTVMRIRIKGTDKEVSKEIIYELYDEFDETAKISSMARTTGFTASGTAEMILNNIFVEKGVFPPELVGKYPECFKYIISYLQGRNVNFKVTIRNI